jgi:hypothetical protein
LFIPWLGRLRANIPEAGTFWLATPDVGKLMTTVIDLTGGVWAASLYGALFLGALCLPLAGRRLRVSDHRLVGVLACWGLLPVLLTYTVAQWTPVFSSRYLLFASPGLYLLVAALLASLPFPGAYRCTAEILLIVVSAVGLNRVVYLKADWRSAAAVIQQHLIPGTTMLTSPRYHCLPLAYYLDPTAFLHPPSMLQSLESSGVFCLDDRRDLRGVTRPSSRLIVARGRLSRLDPEEILLHYGRRRFRLAAQERVEGVTMLVFDVQAHH